MSEDRTEIREALYAIPPEPFEHFIAALWERQGWETTVTDHHSDLGVDIVAMRTDTVVTQSHVIQAKRYQPANVIGRPAIQQYYSLRDQENADAVVIVTTSRFSSQAEAWADEYNLKLVDGAALAELVDDTDATPLLEQYSETTIAEDMTGSVMKNQTSQPSKKCDRRNNSAEPLGIFRGMYDVLTLYFKKGYREAENTEDSERER